MFYLLVPFRIPPFLHLPPPPRMLYSACVCCDQSSAVLAYRCAKLLRETIAPYMLRRLKKDVQQELPQKTEQVLLCMCGFGGCYACHIFLYLCEGRQVKMLRSNPAMQVNYFSMGPQFMSAHLHSSSRWNRCCFVASQSASWTYIAVTCAAPRWPLS